MQPNSKPEDFAEGLLSASEGLAGAGAREQGHRGTARAESSLGALFSRRVNRDASLDGGPGSEFVGSIMQGVLGDAEEQGVGQGPGAGALDPEVTDLSGLLSFGRRSAGIVQGSPESSFTSQNSALPLRASSSRGGAGAGPLLNQPASDSLPASLTFWQQGTSQRPVMEIAELQALSAEDRGADGAGATNMVPGPAVGNDPLLLSSLQALLMQGQNNTAQGSIDMGMLLAGAGGGGLEADANTLSLYEQMLAYEQLQQQQQHLQQQQQLAAQLAALQVHQHPQLLITPAGQGGLMAVGGGLHPGQGGHTLVSAETGLPIVGGVNLVSPAPVQAQVQSQPRRAQLQPAQQMALQDLQEFIMERAELRSAGILSAQDWGAIMAEGQRRLLQLKLPLLEVLRVLSDWLHAGLITQAEFEAARQEAVVGGPLGGGAPPGRMGSDSLGDAADAPGPVRPGSTSSSTTSSAAMGGPSGQGSRRTAQGGPGSHLQGTGVFIPEGSKGHGGTGVFFPTDRGGTGVFIPGGSELPSGRQQGQRGSSNSGIGGGAGSGGGAEGRQGMGRRPHTMDSGMDASRDAVRAARSSNRQRRETSAKQALALSLSGSSFHEGGASAANRVPSLPESLDGAPAGSGSQGSAKGASTSALPSRITKADLISAVALSASLLSRPGSGGLVMPPDAPPPPPPGVRPDGSAAKAAAEQIAAKLARPTTWPSAQGLMKAVGSSLMGPAGMPPGSESRGGDALTTRQSATAAEVGGLSAPATLEPPSSGEKDCGSSSGEVPASAAAAAPTPAAEGSSADPSTAKEPPPREPSFSGSIVDASMSAAAAALAAQGTLPGGPPPGTVVPYPPSGRQALPVSVQAVLTSSTPLRAVSLRSVHIGLELGPVPRRHPHLQLKAQREAAQLQSRHSGGASSSAASPAASDLGAAEPSPPGATSLLQGGTRKAALSAVGTYSPAVAVMSALGLGSEQHQHGTTAELLDAGGSTAPTSNPSSAAPSPMPVSRSGSATDPYVPLGPDGRPLFSETTDPRSLTGSGGGAAGGSRSAVMANARRIVVPGGGQTGCGLSPPAGTTFESLGLPKALALGLADCGYRDPDYLQYKLLSEILMPPQPQPGGPASPTRAGRAGSGQSGAALAASRLGRPGEGSALSSTSGAAGTDDGLDTIPSGDELTVPAAPDSSAPPSPRPTKRVHIVCCQAVPVAGAASAALCAAVLQPVPHKPCMTAPSLATIASMAALAAISARPKNSPQNSSTSQLQLAGQGGSSAGNSGVNSPAPSSSAQTLSKLGGAAVSEQQQEGCAAGEDAGGNSASNLLNATPLAGLVLCGKREDAEDLGDTMRAIAHYMAVPCYTLVNNAYVPAALGQLPEPPVPSSPVRIVITQPNKPLPTSLPTRSSATMPVVTSAAAPAEPAAAAAAPEAGKEEGSAAASPAADASQAAEQAEEGTPAAAPAAAAPESPASAAPAEKEPAAGTAQANGDAGQGKEKEKEKEAAPGKQQAASAAASKQPVVAVGSPSRTLELLRKGYFDLKQFRVLALMDAHLLLGPQFRSQVQELLLYLGHVVHQVLLVTSAESLPRHDLRTIEKLVACAPHITFVPAEPGTYSLISHRSITSAMNAVAQANGSTSGGAGGSFAAAGGVGLSASGQSGGLVSVPSIGSLAAALGSQGGGYATGSSSAAASGASQAHRRSGQQLPGAGTGMLTQQQQAAVAAAVGIHGPPGVPPSLVTAAHASHDPAGSLPHMGSPFFMPRSGPAGVGSAAGPAHFAWQQQQLQQQQLLQAQQQQLLQQQQQQVLMGQLIGAQPVSGPAAMGGGLEPRGSLMMGLRQLQQQQQQLQQQQLALGLRLNPNAHPYGSLQPQQQWP